MTPSNSNAFSPQVSLFKCGLVLIAMTVAGCSDSGNRVVETTADDVLPQTAQEAQAAAEADLPKP